MRAGRLDRKIDIERRSVTQDASGEEIITWTKLAARRSASYRPMSGQERFTSDQWIAKEQVEFTVRYSDLLAELNPLDRIVYPAETAGSPEPQENTVYEIMAVHEIGRREVLRVMTARRAEDRNA